MPSRRFACTEAESNLDPKKCESSFFQLNFAVDPAAVFWEGNPLAASSVRQFSTSLRCGKARIELGSRSPLLQ